MSVQLLRLTVQTAHAFGYRVIAQNVDDDTLLTAASQAGCDLGQGAAMAELLTDHTIDYGPLMAPALTPTPQSR